MQEEEYVRCVMERIQIYLASIKTKHHHRIINDRRNEHVQIELTDARSPKLTPHPRIATRIIVVDSSDYLDGSVCLGLVF